MLSLYYSICLYKYRVEGYREGFKEHVYPHVNKCSYLLLMFDIYCNELVKTNPRYTFVILIS